jgi:hypothetical protein
MTREECEAAYALVVEAASAHEGLRLVAALHKPEGAFSECAGCPAGRYAEEGTEWWDCPTIAVLREFLGVVFPEPLPRRLPGPAVYPLSHGLEVRVYGIHAPLLGSHWLVREWSRGALMVDVQVHGVSTLEILRHLVPESVLGPEYVPQVLHSRTVPGMRIELWRP